MKKNEIVKADNMPITVNVNAEVEVKESGVFNANVANQTIYNYSSNIHRPTLPIGFIARHDCYSLMVCDYDDDNLFILRKNKNELFIHYSDEKMKYEFLPFDEDKKKRLGQIPTIVLKPYEEKSEAFIGFIRNIVDVGNQFECSFFLLTSIPVSALLDNNKQLQIMKKELLSELSDQRWELKKGDLWEIMRSICYPLPKI